MRLIEVTFDWHFNMVDPENVPEVNKLIPNALYSFIYAVDTSTSVCNVTSINYTGPTLTVDSGHSVSTNDRLY